MVGRIVIIAALAGILAAGIAFASDATYETPDEAVEAAFVELLPGRNFVGECNTQITPEPSSVCYRGPSDTEGYSLYAADAFLVTDANWWVGIVEVDGGWKPYGAGRCDLFYCRTTAPGDVVLYGFPGGDANCDGSANSQDALLILQIVAKLTTSIGLPCIADADVFPGGGLNSIDALSILQSEAGLIGALPVMDFQFTH